MLFVDQEHTPSPWAGLRFGPYTILETLQRGGMGEVLLAEQTEPDGTKSRVVLKRLLSELLEDDKYVRMFRAEVGVMSRLNHPNIVKVLDLPVLDGKDCLAMEYVQGANVHQLIKRCRKLNIAVPPPLAVYVITEALLGLDYAHNFMLDDGCSLELVHRDVTPGNVLISFLGEVKITDFGIAKSRMSDLSTTVGCVKGTTRYLSPEQIRGEAATPRSDLFSTGIVLVEMLTGRALFDRGTVPPTLFAILNGERPPIGNLLPFSAPKLAAVLERVLSTDPSQRLESARALRTELIVAACELGPLGDRPTLAKFLREVFPSQASARSGENLDLTYLVEVPEVAIIQDSTAAEIKDVVDQMATGAKPLDADQFGSALGSAPVVLAADLTEGLTVPRTSMLYLQVPSRLELPVSAVQPPLPRESTPTVPAGPNAAAIARAERHAGMIWLFVLGVVFGVGLMFFFGRTEEKPTFKDPPPQPAFVAPAPVEAPIRKLAPVSIELPREEPNVEDAEQPPVVAPVVAPVKAQTERPAARASRRRSRSRRAH